MHHGEGDVTGPECPVTRGYGLLERYLARKRVTMANQLITPHLRSGRIVDIGCSEYPFFLQSTVFAQRYGMDKIVNPSCISQFRERDIVLINHDLEHEPVLPFGDDFFDVVTMLAVIEHVDPDSIVGLLREIRRVLRTGGMFILTTPAAWTDGILRLMAALRLVSPLEIQEHKAVYTHTKLSALLQEAKFPKERLQFGYFEGFMNLWATATT